VHSEHFKVLILGKEAKNTGRNGEESRDRFMPRPGYGKMRVAEQFGLRNAALQDQQKMFVIIVKIHRTKFHLGPKMRQNFVCYTYEFVIIVIVVTEFYCKK
jgi:hypothetical protein